MQPPTSIFFPDFRGELWIVGPLIRALLQDTVENFQDMQDKNLQEQTQFKRRLLCLQKIEKMRLKMTRFCLILKWMNKHHSRIKKLEGLHDVVTRSEQSFDHVLKGFTQIAAEFAEWCEPEWDVDSAVHILTTGSYRLLPTNIAEQCRFIFTLDEKQEQEITEWLNRQIRYKLFSSQIPRGLTLKNLQDGMAKMELKGEYRVELSLRMGPQEIPPLPDKERVRWSVFGLSILVRAKQMSRLGEEGNLQEVVNTRQEQSLINFVNQKVRTSRNPLQEMHAIIHKFVLQVLMKVIRTQMNILQAEMGDSVHVIRDRNCVVIQMWKVKENDEEKFQLKTEIKIEDAVLKVCHTPLNPIMHSEELRERFSIRRSCVYVPEIIRNITIFNSNDRLYSLIKSLDGTWPERIRVFDNETKVEVPIDTIQKSHSLHYIDIHLFQSIFVRLFLNRFTGKISLEVELISETYVAKAVQMLNNDYDNLGDCLNLLQQRAVMRSYEILAKILDRVTFLEPFANHPLSSCPCLFIQSKIFPPAHFAFQVKGNEVRIFESRFGKEINRPLEFRLISSAGNFQHRIATENQYDVTENKRAMQILNSLDKDNWIPIVTISALENILECFTEFPCREVLSLVFQRLGLSPKYAKNEAQIHLDGENETLWISDADCTLTYKYTTKENLPTFTASMIESIPKRNAVEFCVNINFPDAVKKLIQLIKDLRSVKIWTKVLQSSDLRKYKVVQLSALPVDIILQKPGSRVKIELRSEARYPHLNVSTDDPPVNLPFLTPLLQIPSNLSEFLELLDNSKAFCKKFHATREAFQAGMRAWRPELKFVVEWSLEPMGKDKFRLFHSPKFSVEVLSISENTLSFQSEKFWEQSITVEKHVSISSGLTRIFTHGPIGTHQEFLAARKQMNAIQRADPVCTLDIFQNRQAKGYLPQLIFSDEATHEETKVITEFYDQFMLFPACPRLISYFGHFLYFVHKSRNVFMSIMKEQLKIFQKLQASPKEPLILFQLTMNHDIHFNKKTDTTKTPPVDTWWIYLRFNFLKVVGRKTRPRAESHVLFDLFEVQEVKPVNLCFKYPTQSYQGGGTSLRLAVWGGVQNKERINEDLMKMWMNRISKEKLSLGGFLARFTEDFDSLASYRI